jgi:hypothetical protein
MSSHPSSPARRRALQWLAGTPLLPIASSLAGFGALGTDAVAARLGPARHWRFGGMAAPDLTQPAQMATTCVASTLQAIDGTGKARTQALGYETFFITGETVPRTGGGQIVAGVYFDVHGAPIVDAADPAGRPFHSDCPDGMSLLTLTRGATPGQPHRVYAVVQFEYTSRNRAGASMYGQLPSPIAVLTLDQDPRSGRLSLVSYHNVDTAPVHGLWITCGASLSPWNTHLSSEEYEPDATSAASNAQFRAFSQNTFGDPTAARPYHYGHVPEVTVHADGTGSIVKHYCLGRISHELVQVMPDERTVLMGDDATDGGLFMFVADRPRDLGAGTLYVATWTLTSTAGGGAGTLQWIRLGHATSAEIEALADTLTAADLVEVRTADPLDGSFTRIHFNGGSQWVRFAPGREKAAAFLETHRWAATTGASMVFTKMEGTTVNARDKVAYVAMSAVRSSMRSRMGLDAVINAGAVYRMPLAGGRSDRDGTPIASDWVPTALAAMPALTGVDLALPDALGNTAHADRIANPDNLKYSEAMRTLFIGEDSGMHVNNFLWAYDVDTGTLTRILSTPSGAESTGLHAADDLNGFTYIASNFQHPGDWEGIHAIVRPILDPLIDANYDGKFGAAVGYLTNAG